MSKPEFIVFVLAPIWVLLLGCAVTLGYSLYFRWTEHYAPETGAPTGSEADSPRSTMQPSHGPEERSNARRPLV